VKMRSVLEHPLVYQSFQQLGGYFGARSKAMRAFLPIPPGSRVGDIGCGPGFIVELLPADVSYTGFDTDARYIAYATRRFGARGRFFHRPFDASAARDHGPFDIVMMNGLLHHLDDEEVHRTLAAVRPALAPGGRLFTLDGCYVEGQSAAARFLLEKDRGRHVRTEAGYRELLARHFRSLEVHVDHQLSWMPCSWVAMVGRK
jgi:SAM-dependent methyltransferase